MDMTRIPDWLIKHRDGWQWRGQSRPDFAQEPGPGQESVWDYPRPPKLASDSRLVRVSHGDLVLAETRAAVRVLETAHPPTFYIPPADVRTDKLEPGSRGSFCEWKGPSQFWSVHTPQGALQDVAWSYPDPLPGFESLAGYLSFYPAHLTCTVEGERVQPQPGSFYGGWITADIAGPVKGEPGSSGW